MQFLLIANKKRHGGRVICLRKDGASFPKENLWGKIAGRQFFPAFQGSAFRLHCLRNGSAALPIGARFYLLYVLKTYSLLQTSISMLSASNFLSRLSAHGSTTLTNCPIMTPFVPRIGVLMQSSRESGLGATGRKIWMKIHLRGANEVSGSLITAARGCCKQPTGFFSQIFLVVEPKTDSRVSAVLSCNFCKNPLYLEKN